MFFKKKPNDEDPNSKQEVRAHYRKLNPKSRPLEATLRVEGWDPIPVEVIDITVRGTGIRVPFAQDRNLRTGQVVELTIGTIMRNEIYTPARVANIGRDGETHVRYGLEFLNTGNLYSQLDSFYARFFNRRKTLRVLPSLDRKIQATLQWGGSEQKVHVYDVSESGVGVVVSKDTAVRLSEVPSFEVCFSLPGIEGECRGRAVVEHRSPLYNQVLLGMSFDLEDPNGIQRHVEKLRSFVEQRSAEMAMWEKNWS